jgi:hypothetical protein
MPTPRAAAASVLAMLAFGVLIGSFGNTSLESLASSPLLVLASRPPTHAGGPAAAPGSGGSLTSAQTVTQTVTTITQTPSQPSASNPAASTGGGGGSTGGNGTANSGGSSSLLGLPPIHHVFLIVMSDQGFGQTFAPGSPDSYLSSTLVRQGELIQDYYAVAGSELANRIALISGDGPTQQTAADCPVFATIKPATKHALGQIIGSGCVYPPSVDTLADELTAAHKTWKAYVEGIDKGPRGQPSSCRHPKLGAGSGGPAPSPADPYLTWSNPFVYFSSVTRQQACRQNDVSLDQLSKDLKSNRAAPTFAYVTPGACDNGSETPCSPDATAGLEPADAFLNRVVVMIKDSAAYRDNGLIAITFDEAPQNGAHADPSACCNTPRYPNLTGTSTTVTTAAEVASTPTTSTTSTTTAGSSGTETTTTGPPTDTTTTTGTTTTTSTTTTTATSSPPIVTTTTTATGSPPSVPPPTPPPPATTVGTTTTSPTTTTTSTTTSAPASGGTGQTTPTGGGGQVGLLLISPYVKPGTTDLVDYYNHFSLLATIENLFGVKRLGYAGDLSLPVFDAAIFNGHQ